MRACSCSITLLLLLTAGFILGCRSARVRARHEGPDQQSTESIANVYQFGAVGDGHANDTKALQQALDSGKRIIQVPKGIYIIRRTLLIDSDTTLRLEKEAVIRLGDGAAAEAGGDCFLIRNRDFENGNENITINGGTWDGNCANNPRGDEYATNSYGGVGISFMKVNNLTLQNLTMHNNESFAIRVGEVDRFRIDNIHLDHTVIRPNQDGIHVGGFSKNGVIRNISATHAKVPNDDMVALNADDDVTRHFNRGMKLGPIQNILVENVSAKDAYTFVRLLSNTSPIRNVTIRNIRGGCRMYCLNLNRWRFPKGRGNIENVLLEDVKVSKNPGNSLPLIPVSLSVRKMRIKNFIRTDHYDNAKTLVIDDAIEADISVDIRSAAKSKNAEQTN